jgi:hypothetical protein
MKLSNDSIAEKELKIDELCQEIYAQKQHLIRPLYPWILVRIMPKANRVGLIFTPEKQNKIFYEGVVLQTWEPFWKPFRSKKNDSGEWIHYQVEMKSQVARGDRVMFMHFEGQPVPFLHDELHYRMIHEVETHPNGGIWAVLEDAPEDEGLREKLNDIFKGEACLTISGGSKT